MHQTNIRIYYEDTDAGGVVYYANYLKFAERARTEWLRGLGFDQSQLLLERDTAFVVRHATLDIKQPARLDDLLTITTEISDIGGASISMQQSIARGDVLLANVSVKLAIVSAAFKPKRIPDWLLEKINNAPKH